MSRHRTRRIAKWTGLTTLGLLLAALVGNQWWSVQCITNDVWIGADAGGLWMGSLPPGRYDPFFKAQRGSRGMIWSYEFIREGALGGAGWCLVIPLWPLVVVIAIPTAWLWRRGRRHRPGHCRNCGYDLTGNVTGVCSECGTKVEGS